MDSVYSSIVARPGKWLLWFLVTLIVVAVTPTSLLTRLTFWEQSPEWARAVMQFGTLLVVVVGGVIPIAKWYDERVLRVVSKPIVVTDLLADGTLQIRNIGEQPAVNVWMLIPGQETPLCLGSLDAHDDRELSQTVGNGRHLLLAAARPGSPRPYTITFNVLNSGDVAYRHGFLEEHTGERLRRGGTVEDYLRHERNDLMRQFDAFAPRHPEGEAR
jgi:hypothetical protein